MRKTMKQQNKKVRKQNIKRTKTVTTKRKQFIKRRKTVNTNRKTCGGQGEESLTNREYQFNKKDIKDYLGDFEEKKNSERIKENKEPNYFWVSVWDVYNELYPRPRTMDFDKFDELDLKTRKYTFYAALFNIICRFKIEKLSYEKDSLITRRLKREFNDDMGKVFSFLYHTSYLSFFGDTKISSADVAATVQRFTEYIKEHTESLEEELYFVIHQNK